MRTHIGVAEIRHGAVLFGKCGVANDFRGFDCGQHVAQSDRRVRSFVFVNVEFARAYIAPCKSESVFYHVNRGKIVAGTLVKNAFFHDGSRRNHTHDVAVDEPLRSCGVAQLLADCDTVSRVDKPADVGVHGMIRDTAHGRTFFQAAIAPR